MVVLIDMLVVVVYCELCWCLFDVLDCEEYDCIFSVCDVVYVVIFLVGCGLVVFIVVVFEGDGCVLWVCCEQLCVMDVCCDVLLLVVFVVDCKIGLVLLFDLVIDWLDSIYFECELVVCWQCVCLCELVSFVMQGCVVVIVLLEDVLVYCFVFDDDDGDCEWIVVDLFGECMLDINVVVFWYSQLVVIDLFGKLFVVLLVFEGVECDQVLCEVDCCWYFCQWCIWYGVDIGQVNVWCVCYCGWDVVVLFFCSDCVEVCGEVVLVLFMWMFQVGNSVDLQVVMVCLLIDELLLDYFVLWLVCFEDSVVLL